MPIEIFSGLPGHGKTSLMVERLLAESRKGERPIWAAGIDGLMPGYATVLRNPFEWNAVKPGERCTCSDTDSEAECVAHEIPNGSLIFVDEAWKWFGHLHNASRQLTPAHVLALAEHRHRGIDFVWTLQSPVQIYPFAREMIERHHHVVRKFGTPMIDVFTWGELCDDVKSLTRRDAALRNTRTLPSGEVRVVYKSAEVHTIKARIPVRVYMIPVLILGLIAAVWFAYQSLKPSNMAAKVRGADMVKGLAPAGAQGVLPLGGGVTHSPRDPLDYADWYAERFQPRIEQAPWSSPAFDQREAAAEPVVYCMSSKAGYDAQGEWDDDSVTCLTEQGTRYSMPENFARGRARFGPMYDPFKAPAAASSSDRSAPSVSQPAQSVFHGTAISADGVAERQPQHSIGGGIGGAH